MKHTACVKIKKHCYAKTFVTQSFIGFEIQLQTIHPRAIQHFVTVLSTYATFSTKEVSNRWVSNEKN